MKEGIFKNTYYPLVCKPTSPLMVEGLFGEDISQEPFIWQVYHHWWYDAIQTRLAMPELLPLNRAEGETIIQVKFDLTYKQIRKAKGGPDYKTPHPDNPIYGTVNKHTTILWERGVMRVFLDPEFKFELVRVVNLNGWLTSNVAA